MSLSIAVWKQGIKTFDYWNLDRSGGLNPDLRLIGTHFDGTNCTLIHTFYRLSSTFLSSSTFFSFSFLSLVLSSLVVFSCLLFSCLSSIVCLVWLVNRALITLTLANPNPNLRPPSTSTLCQMKRALHTAQMAEEVREEYKLMEKDEDSEQNKGATKP